MVNSAGEGTSYSGGAGGKFRKKPYRKTQTTPYDRPPTALRNPRANGPSWMSWIVDPASKLITAGAHLFLSPVIRKRLPPPPPPGAIQESTESFQDAILDSPVNDRGPVLDACGKLGVAEDQGLGVKDSGKQIAITDSSGLSELELMLKQKNFTRSEIDRLTELLHSRAVDVASGDVDKKPEFCYQEPACGVGGQDTFERSFLQENRNGFYLDNHRFGGHAVAAAVSSKVLKDDVLTPAELAKAYMGSRSSKVPPSVLGLRSQAMREGPPALSNSPFVPESPVMSLVQKPAVHIGGPESGYVTPRSRGRSAIYNMTRTPYSRVHPTDKGNGSIYDGYDGPFASSSGGFAQEIVRRSASKELSLKRRSSVFGDEIGAVGPIRRLRQKTNLSTPINVRFPVAKTLSSCATGISKTSGVTEDNNNMPGTSNTPVPSQSKETARKILQQLQKLAPNEKLLEGRVSALSDKSPSELTQNMLHGRALKSLEDVDSSKFLHDAGDNLKFIQKASLPDMPETSTRGKDKVEGSGRKSFNVSRGAVALAGTSNGTVSFKESEPPILSSALDKQPAVTESSQKKWAFQMSAHEDLLELDDEIHSNGAATSGNLAEGKEIMEAPMVDDKSVPQGTVAVDKTLAVSEPRAPAGSSDFGKATDLVTTDGTKDFEKKIGFTTSGAPAASMSFDPVVCITQSTTPFAKAVSDKEPSAPLNLCSDTKNDPRISSFTFPPSSSVDGSLGLKLTALTEVKPENRNSFAVDASGAAGTVLQPADADSGVNKNFEKPGDAVGKPEISFSLPQSTPTSTSNLLTFGSNSSFSNQSNGLHSTPSNQSNGLHSTPSVFSSPSPVLPTSNSGNQALPNPFTSVPFSTTSSLAMNSTAASAITSDATPSTLTTSPSTPVTPSFKFGSASDGIPSTTTTTTTTTISAPHPTTPLFKFGSSSPSPLVSNKTALTTSNATDIKASTEKETSAGNLPGNPFGGMPNPFGAGTGSSIFGLSAGSTSSNTSFSQGSLFCSSSGASVSTQRLPVFGSSSASLTSGTSGSASFAPSNSLSGSGFGNPTSSSSIFGINTSSCSQVSSSPFSSSPFGSATVKDFGSSSSFGLSSTSALSTETKSVTSTTPTSTLWPAPSTGGFSFGATSPSTGFGSSTGASSASIFSFNAAAAAPTPTQTQPVFGSSAPAFASSSGNGGDQMTMEDSMAEDPVVGSAPSVPGFGQPQISNPSPGFMFGSTPSPFQFGGQLSQGGAQNPSPFQPSGSLDFGGGGSFSLGSGGGDKSGRKIIRVNRKNRRK